MILFKGQIYGNEKQSELLPQLKDELYRTIKDEVVPTYELVINACEVLYQRVLNHKYDDIALPLMKSLNIPGDMLEKYASYFSKDGLLKKVHFELGDLLQGDNEIDDNNTRSYAPLGILFHIAAGNVDLLPAYSVIEGLLVGNINILKLPSGDNGLSVKLLKELIDIEPSLANFIYVFDVPSVEIDTIKYLSSLSDATIVWGGEEVSSAARKFVDIHSSLIIWGHKISFSYVDNSVTDLELTHLAESICMSNQLLCSSSQGIYLDSDNKNDLRDLAKRFLPILTSVSKKMETLPLTMKAKNSLLLYNEKLEEKGENIYQSEGVSVCIKDDAKLELSLLFQNVWVKPLKRDDIINTLKPNKNLLQTVSINRDMKDRMEVENLLFKAGATRITRLGENSRMIPGESHDGEYPLRRYIRIIEKSK